MPRAPSRAAAPVKPVVPARAKRVAAAPRITRALPVSAGRVAHFVDLHSAAEVDAEVRDWLEAYFSSRE